MLIVLPKTKLPDVFRKRRFLIDLWVFDNDGTLYDDKLVHAEFARHLASYLAGYLGIPSADAEIVGKQLRVKYSTSSTVIALVREFKLDISEVIERTYLRIDLDSCQVLTKDPERDEALKHIGGRKLILTNNPSVFARRIVERIGLLRHFDDIVGMEETAFVLKPNPGAFLTVMRRHPDATRIFLCDDSLENLDVAATLGWKTVWYSPNNDGNNSVSPHTILRSFSVLPGVRDTLFGEA